MGLGPPVCLRCMKVMDLCETNWHCSVCGLVDEPPYTDCGNLFEMSAEQIKEMDEKWGENWGPGIERLRRLA
jgi:predicted amidophosphoribosyltransferase